MRDESRIAERPQVSIIVPVHDEGTLLAEAVQSILGQTGDSSDSLPSFEIIVIDDASTDPITLRLLEELPAHDQRIRVVKNQRCKGVSGARNTGILAATGHWLAFLDADDRWFEHALMTRWRAVETHPNAKWVAARHISWRPGTGLDGRDLREDSPILHSHIGTDYAANRVCRLPRPIALFLIDCPVQTGTVMCKRELAIDKGMFDESISQAEDYLLWLNFSIDNDLYYVPATVSAYRVRPGSISRSGNPIDYGVHAVLEKLARDERFRVYEKQMRKRMRRVLSSYCFFYRQARRRSEALRWSVRLLARDPFHAQSWKHLIAAAAGR